MNDTIATRNLSWLEIVQRSWGKDYTAPETAYVFTNNRKFLDNTEQFDGVTLDSGSIYADNYADNYA